MSSCQETTHLNPAGQVALTGFASLVVNGVTHPLSTIKNCLMAGQVIPRHGLYRGFFAIFGVDAITFALAYSTHDELRSRTSPLFAAAIAGMISALPVAVGEGLMVNRQVNNLTYSQSMQRAIRPAGFIATIMRETPFTLALFVFSPKLQQSLPFSNEIISQGVSGSIAGSLAGFFTTPFDRIKTIVQTTNEHISISSTARRIINREGIRGLFAGSMPRSLYVGLAAAIMSVIYQTTPLFPASLKME